MDLSWAPTVVEVVPALEVLVVSYPYQPQVIHSPVATAVGIGVAAIQVVAKEPWPEIAAPVPETVVPVHVVASIVVAMVMPVVAMLVDTADAVVVGKACSVEA